MAFAVLGRPQPAHSSDLYSKGPNSIPCPHPNAKAPKCLPCLGCGCRLGGVRSVDPHDLSLRNHYLFHLISTPSIQAARTCNQCLQHATKAQGTPDFSGTVVTLLPRSRQTSRVESQSSIIWWHRLRAPARTCRGTPGVPQLPTLLPGAWDLGFVFIFVFAVRVCPNDTPTTSATCALPKQA